MFSHTRNFDFADIPDLSGKVAAVTGGNSGIGYVTCRELARKNAHVFILTRNIERGTTAVEKIKQETENQNIEFLQLDLQSLKSVKECAESFLARKLPLHILINNAAIVATKFSLTVDGIQDQFGVNHVGHFYLTKLLLPTLEASAPSRIVNVSSDGHKFATGNVNTEVVEKLTNNLGKWSIPIFWIAKFILLTPDDGALTTLYCATSPEIEKKNLRGKFFIPFGVESSPHNNGKDEELAKKLWQFTDDL
nr:3291_t:CDS:2 [Entrophospora candida]